MSNQDFTGYLNAYNYQRPATVPSKTENEWRRVYHRHSDSQLARDVRSAIRDMNLEDDAVRVLFETVAARLDRRQADIFV